ncbi:PREDICTED: glycerate kinase-like, partial [Priapulus caudatus]|uniref:Glycerate kinase-like n=1 Tax=Priapulus caudatus TaxID=37621 RepID=A0ABM1EDY3_PRICU
PQRSHLQVLALLLSDIVGDPLELIASGPTVPDNSGPDPLAILYRYKLEDAIPGSAWSILCETDRRGADPGVAARVQNVLVGTNTLAVAAARARAAALGYRALVISEALTGEARRVGAMFARLLLRVRRTYDAVADGDLAAARRVAEAWDDVPAAWRDAVCRDEAFLEGVASGTPLCFIAGGETTVTLQGTGKGGRNQEMALP